MMPRTNLSVFSNIFVKNMGFDNKFRNWVLYLNTAFVDSSHILYLKHKNLHPLLQRVQIKSKKCNDYSVKFKSNRYTKNYMVSKLGFWYGGERGIRTPEAALTTYTISNRAP